MNKWWVLYLKDGSYKSVQAEDKDEAKKIAWETLGITWLDIVKYELYYR